MILQLGAPVALVVQHQFSAIAIEFTAKTPYMGADGGSYVDA
jgi:hypothetical protein